MKNQRLLISMAAAAMMASFAACSNDINDAADDPTIIHFTSKVVDSPVSRAATDIQTSQLASGVKVGVFATSDNSSCISNGDNAILTADGSGALTPSTDMKWPATGALNFYAYAPYSENNDKSDSSDSKLGGSISFAVSDDQTTQDNYLASDLLYAKSESATNGQKVTLAFTHKLSKVIIKLKTPTKETVTLSQPSVNLLNVVKSGTLKVSDGTFTASTTETGTVAVHSFGSSESTYECAAIIAPQTISSGTAFIQVVNDGKTYNCSLSADKDLAAGGSYIFNVSFDGKAVSVESDSSLTEWSAEEGTGTDVDAEEQVTYTVGDYLLADGTFVKKEDVGNNSPVGVIFSTDVSTTDKGNGYTAYILGFSSLSTAKPQSSGTLTFAESNYEGVSSLKEAAEDLDGLSHTQYVQTQSDYASNFPLFDLSGMNGVLTSNTDNFSTWFIPSIGQMIQIVNNLGKGKIPTTYSAYKYYVVMPNYTDYTTQDSNSNVSITFSGKLYLFATSPKLSEVISSLLAATNNTTVIKNGGRYAVSTLEKGATTTSTYLMDMSQSFIPDTYNTNVSISDKKGEAWGISTGSVSNSARDRIAVIATKSTQIVAPTSTDSE